jgi:hypothetical protein
MKKNISIKLILALAVVYLSAGCDKITEINRSPNNPPVELATPQVLFPSGVQSTAGRVGGELAIIGGIWSQYWTQAALSNQYKDIDSYGIQRQDRNGNYSGLMAGALNDYKLTIEKAKASGPIQYYLMATVMKAYTYQVLVDLYDQVPYTEALQGQANLQPKFDDGYTIYKGLIAEIDAALAATATADNLAPAANASTDFVFIGNMAKWRAFANTLKLKMFLRMVNAKPAEAEAGVKKLYADGATFLTEAAAVTSYVNTPDQGNPFYEYNVRRLGVGNLRASKTFVTWLVANSDPRITPYFGATNPGSINQGDYAAVGEPTYANAATPVQKATDPVWFISKAESYFLQAEARLRYGVGSETDASLYRKGLVAAFAEQGLAEATIPTSATYVYPAAGTLQAKLKTIIVQKWAALPGSHSLEAFFEQERTGYPEISPVTSKDASYASDHAGEWVYSFGGITSGKRFPKRLVFPDVEASRNPNTPDEVPITTPVWWGK